MLRATLMVLSACVFVLACALPAAHGHGGFLEGGVDPDGWHLLLTGWMAVMFFSVYFLAWMANPLWALAVVCLWKREDGAAALLAAAGAVLSLIPLGALLWSSGVPAIRLEPPVALVFSGGSLELRVGFFVWVCGQLLLLACATLLWSVEGTEYGPGKPAELSIPEAGDTAPASEAVASGRAAS